MRTVVSDYATEAERKRARAELARLVKNHGGEVPAERPPPQPLRIEPGRCPVCREEKSWLKPGETCARCLMPQGQRTAPAVEDEHEEAQPMVLRWETTMAKAKTEPREAVSEEKKRGGRKAGTWDVTPEAFEAWRAAQGHSRATLAGQLGVSPTTIQNWGTGNAIPTPKSQEQIAKLMAGEAVASPAKRQARQAQPEATPPVGTKLDASKPRCDLLPPRAILGLAGVLGFGAEKYAPDNWRKVPDARRRYFAAALRHVFAAMAGEERDAESGLRHVDHATCCLMFVSELEHEAGGAA